MKPLRMDCFEASDMRTKPNEFRQLIRAQKSMMTTDRAVPVTGALQNQMDVLKRERLGKNKDILMMLPTKKTDREPHRWNIVCHKNNFIEVQKCAFYKQQHKGKSLLCVVQENQFANNSHLHTEKQKKTTQLHI